MFPIYFEDLDLKVHFYGPSAVHPMEWNNFLLGWNMFRPEQLRATMW